VQRLGFGPETLAPVSYANAHLCTFDGEAGEVLGRGQ
jgi:hypothetical protein